MAFVDREGHTVYELEAHLASFDGMVVPEFAVHSLALEGVAAAVELEHDLDERTGIQRKRVPVAVGGVAVDESLIG